MIIKGPVGCCFAGNIGHDGECVNTVREKYDELCADMHNVAEIIRTGKGRAVLRWMVASLIESTLEKHKL